MTTNVLPTKLYIPSPDADVVPRVRLNEMLSAPGSVRLVLVSAPAGSGKTTLVASWVREADVPVGWLSLDGGDDDPVDFLAGFAEASATLEPDVRERATSLLAATPPPEPRAVAAALIADLARSGATGKVVLDDYHMVQAQSVHGIVETLVERLPPGITLVIVTRSDPPLPLARLRARGQLIEIRAEHLRFDEAESAAFLKRFTDRTLRPESMTALTTRTEGWAAGLQLAGLALRSASDPDAFVAGFAGTHAFVADYLTDEVLDALPAGHQEFLIRCSILNRLCGPLCDAAFARTGSADLLDTLRRANLFLIPLDGERFWLRFHHLFRDLLRRRARARDEDEVREILIRASDWCQSAGQVDDAIRYAVEAGATARAADLVAGHALAALAAGQALTTLRWIRLLPDAVVRSSPDHCVIAAWSHSLVEEHARVVDFAQAAHARVEAGDRPYRHIDGVEEHVDVILAGARTLARGEDPPDSDGHREAHARLVEALRRIPPDDLLLGASAEVMAGNTLNLQARYEKAMPAFARCDGLADRAGSDLLRLAAATGTAESLLFSGQLAESAALIDDVLGRRRVFREIIGSQAANLYGIRAMAHLETGRLAAALEDARLAWRALGAPDDDEEGLKFMSRYGHGRPSAFHTASPGVYYSVMARVRALIATNDPDAVLGVLDRLEAILARKGSIARIVLENLAVRAMIASGERIAIQRMLRAAEPIRTGVAFWDRASILAHARAAYAARDPATCLHLLEPHLNAMETCGAVLQLAEARVVKAIACVEAGRGAAAERVADDTLELTAARGMTMVWIDAGEAVRPLLQSAVARAAASPSAIAHALELLDALGTTRTPVDSNQGDLSDRELEILRMLAAGHSNQEIADALFLAIGTVKKHTHNIYGKLRVGSRTRAVRVARDRGILVPEK